MDPLFATTAAFAAAPPAARWACSACTLLNEPDDQCCAVCLIFRSDAALAAATAAADDPMAPRKSKAAPTAAAAAVTTTPSGASWNCSSCTLSNRKLRTTCRACGACKPAAASSATSAASSVDESPAGPVRSSKRRKGLDREVVAVDSDSASDALAEAMDADDDHDEDEAMAAAIAVSATPAAKGRKGRSSTKKRRSGAIASAAAPSFAASMSAPAPASASFSPASMLASMGLSFGGFSGFGAAPSAAASSASSAASPKKPALPALTAEDSRAELTDAECTPFYADFTIAARMHAKHKSKKNGKKDTVQPAVSAKEDAADKQALEPILHSLYKALGYKGSAAASSNAAASSSSAAASASSSSSPLRSSQCQSCYTEWCDDCQPVQVQNCGHAEFCSDCFSQVVCIKIKEEAVMPWLGCPSAGCRHPLTVRDLAAAASTAQLAHLAFVYMRKRLVRNECFVSCQTRDCGFGFVVQNTKGGKVPKGKKMTCVLCNVEQMVEKGKEGELDDTFKAMIAKGELRPCPKCNHLTMKEKGVCNVLQCVKCSVWWNWRTKETGKDSTTLKNKARQTGSLWEAGELEFQRRLEQTNPEEFKKLLERNGGKYDPNYVRGQG